MVYLPDLDRWRSLLRLQHHLNKILYTFPVLPLISIKTTQEDFDCGSCHRSSLLNCIGRCGLCTVYPAV